MRSTHPRPQPPGQRVTARVDERSVDPVAPLPWTTLRVVDDVLKHPAASSDHARRCVVVLVARDEDAIDVVRSGDDQALGKDPRGEASTAERRTNGVADVPPAASKKSFSR